MQHKKILITGGAGYIGSKLTEMLLRQGHKVTVVDNLMYNQTSLFHLASNLSFKFLHSDVSNPDTLDVILASEKPNVIIPLAALVGVAACEKNPIIAKKVNRDHIYQICRYIKYSSSTATVIYPNTNSGYGLGLSDPDGKPVYCTENDSLKPISLYGRTKCDAEHAVARGDRNIVFRLATVFGFSPRMRLDLLVNDFVYRALTDKYIVLFESHFRRNYIHISDVCRAFLDAVEGRIAPGIYNLGLPEENLTKLELAERIKDYVPDFVIFEDEIFEDPDKRNYIVSNEKILMQGFGFRSYIDDGIKELIEAYKMLIPLDVNFTNK